MCNRGSLNYLSKNDMKKLSQTFSFRFLSDNRINANAQ